MIVWIFFDSANLVKEIMKPRLTSGANMLIDMALCENQFFLIGGIAEIFGIGPGVVLSSLILRQHSIVQGGHGGKVLAINNFEATVSGA